ncbi:aminopeptidase [Aureococcus anophagefferens]|nr:aminopeptidase [Aureococcus anophagefferens]
MVAMRLGRRSDALKASRMPNAGKVVPSDRARARAEAMIGLIDASPTPYHMARNVKEQLVARGFTELEEGEPWSDVVEAGGKYLITRHEGTIIAVAVGGRCDGTKAAFKLLGGHTDTPVLKVRPVSKRSDADGKDKSAAMAQVGVECYGGGLWHTWLDRDLGVAGRAVVRNGDGTFDARLVRVDAPVVRVPSLCIHLQTAAERDALTLNKETDLQPVLCSTAAAQLQPSADDDAEAPATDGWASHHPPALVDLVAHELGVEPEDVADFDLTLFDTQAGAISGAFGEFVASARLDDQAACYALTEALLGHVDDADAFADDADVSAQGSGAKDGLEDAEALAVAMRRSILLSVDMAHAVHPNYAHKHDGAHAPRMNHGLVLKVNNNQRYTTDAVTGFLLRETARRGGLPELQDFVVRNDCPCGSTIGPILASRFGIRAADVGMPQLSMHSIREMGGVHDIDLSVDFGWPRTRAGRPLSK